MCCKSHSRSYTTAPKSSHIQKQLQEITRSTNKTIDAKDVILVEETQAKKKTCKSDGRGYTTAPKATTPQEIPNMLSKLMSPMTPKIYVVWSLIPETDDKRKSLQKCLQQLHQNNKTRPASRKAQRRQAQTRPSMSRDVIFGRRHTCEDQIANKSHSKSYTSAT